MALNPGKPPADRPPRGGGRPRVVWLLGAAAVAVAGSVAYRAFSPPAGEVSPPTDERPERPLPPDPRLAYDGPFQNVRPGVGYVGNAACAECHAGIAAAYARHPMGRSAAPAGQLAGQLPTDEAHHNPFDAFGVRFRVVERDGRVTHRLTPPVAAGEPAYEFAHEVAFAVGSGTRGFSYLTVRDGFVFQSPVSWFTQKEVWDLSPGFPPWARAGRLIQGACLYCHVNRVEPVEGTRNRYHEPVLGGNPVGCERCHGPGELHARSSGRDDVVHPGRLAPALAEAVCQQCHLGGAARVQRAGRGLNDYRPGMPLEEFWTVFVAGPGGGENPAVGHVEQMHESGCFRGGSAGRRIGCTSCHDPHEAAPEAGRGAYYRERCLRCHAPPGRGCAVPEPARRAAHPDDACAACHMPRAATSDIPHTASTDHRVPRRPGAARPGPARAAKGPPLVDFHRGPADVRDVGLGRDLGVAIYHRILKGVPLTEADGALAGGLLDRALAECPADLEAWEAKGKVLQTVGRPAEAAAAYEALLRRSPRHETALVTLGVIHRDLGAADEAVAYWRRAVEVNPWVAEYRRQLATLLAGRNDWAAARPHARRWLDLDPASTEARCLWVWGLVQEGRKAEAAAEYARVRALRPPDLPQLDARYLPLLR